MITFENIDVVGLVHALRGMRNPMNSWDKSDSGYCLNMDCNACPHLNNYDKCQTKEYDAYVLGPNDNKLAISLAKGGPVHAKYRRMIVVYIDIVAPLYWWKEFDTYKVGTVSNSCSTMHKIHSKEFKIDDFSHEHLDVRAIEVLKFTIGTLNGYRDLYIKYDADDFIIKRYPSKKDIWWQMIQLLPSSYNQKRTIMLNYEVLADIYRDRNNHKLDEWVRFCEMIESLPESHLITLKLREE